MAEELFHATSIGNVIRILKLGVLAKPPTDALLLEGSKRKKGNRVSVHHNGFAVNTQKMVNASKYVVADQLFPYEPDKPTLLRHGRPKPDKEVDNMAVMVTCIKSYWDNNLKHGREYKGRSGNIPDSKKRQHPSHVRSTGTYLTGDIAVSEIKGHITFERDVSVVPSV